MVRLVIALAVLIITVYLTDVFPIRTGVCSSGSSNADFHILQE